jgi:hypothetical protein
VVGASSLLEGMKVLFCFGVGLLFVRTEGCLVPDGSDLADTERTDRESG